MRVLISGGGTGGHVYPALAVVDQLAGPNPAPPREQPENHPAAPAGPKAPAAASPNPTNSPQATQILWVGRYDGLEQGLVERAGLSFRGIDTGQLRGINPLTALLNAGKMVRGVGQALAILKEFQPDVCFVTGGYVCVPVAVACKLRGIPLLIYLPDMAPGLAIKWLSILAQKVAVSFPDAAAYFPGKAVVTGYPVRGELVQAAQDRPLARQKLADALSLNLGLAESETPPLLMVWGGSQGSRSINKAVQANLAALLPVAHILHVTGTLDYDRVVGGLADLPTAWQNRYHPVAYLHDEMPLALAAADVSVCRAGASTLGELPVARLSSVLVPLPIAGGHQWPNAHQLADHGGGVIVADDALGTELVPALIDLLQTPARRHQMETALADLAQPAAAANIAKALVKLANMGPQ